ncbi:MAG: hypothetical protein ACYC1U_10980 [Candidatus Aquicultorales bacterium]
MRRYICPTCGRVDVEPLGVCKICLQSVCIRCGTEQSTLSGPVVTHSSCFREHPEMVGASFKLFKFKKA